MTNGQRISTIQTMLGEEVDTILLDVYLRLAISKILNHRYPFGTIETDVEPRFEMDLLELTIVLFNERGAEGQSVHSENGVKRDWRTEYEILKGIPPMASAFNEEYEKLEDK